MPCSKPDKDYCSNPPSFDAANIVLLTVAEFHKDIWVRRYNLALTKLAIALYASREQLPQPEFLDRPETLRRSNYESRVSRDHRQSGEGLITAADRMAVSNFVLSNL